ncbi:MAG: M3 family oligoendopeptidase [Balneolales bacterium]|nr:M3 family oligoendopeptidase [Balneolales bacterium]
MKKVTGSESIKWNLDDLYKSTDDPALKEDKLKIVEMAESFSSKYKGEIDLLSPSELKDALAAYEEIYDLMSKIGSYAYLAWSADTENASLGKLMQESNELGAEVNQHLVFFDLEMLAFSDDKAESFSNSKELEGYRHYLKVSRKYKPYMLSEEQEQLLSLKSVTGKNAWVRYFDETLGAARFSLNEETLTEQEVLSKLHESDRALRELAANSLTDGLKKLSRTLTFIFNTLLADKASTDKLRKYPDWLTSRNLSNEIKSETVDSLVSSVTAAYPVVQRYYKLKASLLGLDKLKDFDRYAPVAENETTVTWNKAKEMVLMAYGKFSPEMEEIAAKFFDEQWIDAAIRPGKRGGAYSASTAVSVHPYVFMNYDGKIRDVQTLAHELGHGVHQYLSREQGPLQAGTPLTTAETASVFGEMLVFQDLMARLEKPEEKLALLMGKIDDTIATVFRQVSMNRFENAMHNARRNEGELSAERFNELWMNTQRELYGDSVELTDNYQYWWSYIPHFLHTPGYVYAYAFGELLVLSLYDRYKHEPNGFPDAYIEVLKAGGSASPEELTQKLGVDINNENFWKSGLRFVSLLVDEAEELAAQIKQQA